MQQSNASLMSIETSWLLFDQTNDDDNFVQVVLSELQIVLYENETAHNANYQEFDANICLCIHLWLAVIGSYGLSTTTTSTLIITYRAVCFESCTQITSKFVVIHLHQPDHAISQNIEIIWQNSIRTLDNTSIITIFPF